MNSHRPTLTRAAAVVAMGVTLTLALTSCTSDDPAEPTETTTTSGAPSTPETPELTDRSDLVTAYTIETEPIGTTKGEWATLISRMDATLVVYSAEAFETTTRLTYQIHSTNGRPLSPATHLSPELLPSLVDTTDGGAYRVNTTTIAHPVERRLAIGSEVAGRSTGFAPSYAQYPPLPENVTTIDIVTPNFETISDVPVTRR